MISEPKSQRRNSLKENIAKLVENRYTDEDLESVITQLSNILASMIKRAGNSLLIKTGYSPKDVAYIALATLFVKDQNGRFPSLEKIFSGEKGIISLSEDSFHHGLFAILKRILKETLYSLITESRPEWEKLRRSFMNAVKNSKEFSLIKGSGGYLILGKEIPEALKNNPVSYEMISEICHHYRLFYKGPIQFIRNLAKALRKEGIIAPVRLKDIVSAFLEMNLVVEASFQSDSDLEKTASEATKEKLKEILEEIEKENNEIIEKYVKKNKLIPSEKDSFLKALNEIIFDWLQGGNTRTFFDYLKSYIGDIDKSLYRKEKRKILEYLVKRAKNKLAEKVKERFSAK